MEGVNIKFKKVILIFLGITLFLFIGFLSNVIFPHNEGEVHGIKDNALSFAASKGSNEVEDMQYLLGMEGNIGDWKDFSEFTRNYSEIIRTNNTFYLRVKLLEGKWTNPAIYLKGIKADSYEAYIDGRILYKSSKKSFGKDLDLDTIYKDVIIPLGIPLSGIPYTNQHLSTDNGTNTFNSDFLIIKLKKVRNRNITPITEEKSILMGEHKDIISYTVKDSIKKIALNSIIAAIAIISIVLGILFKGRDRRILLSLSSFVLCMVGYGISNASSINSILLDAPIIWSYLFYISLAYSPYTFAYFFEHVFEGARNSFLKIIRKIQAISALLLMCTILLYTLTKGRINIIYAGTYALYATLLILVIITLFYSIIGALKRNSEALIFTIGISIYISFIVYALFNNTYINEAGLILFILSLIIITARRFYNMNQDIIINSKELEIKNNELQLAWEEINESKEKISELNKTLERRVQDRTKALEISNWDLKIVLEKLQHTQNQMIQSEKMAALGGLVAGVSHEINTPIGVSVTAASHLQEKTKEISGLYKNSLMKKSDLEKYLSLTDESTEVILTNLQRASELVKSFKQVAVDQSDEQKRTFRLKEYTNQVLLSLKPKLKKTKISVGVNCEDELEIDSFPGAFSQIITNLVMNSLIHAFDEGQEGTIIFDIEKDNDIILFTYSDNGKGMSEDIAGKIFDPFFTTKRGKGGTGLGLNIVYNIVTQTLRGSIECKSELNVGTIFKITFPVN